MFPANTVFDMDTVPPYHAIPPPLPALPSDSVAVLLLIVQFLSVEMIPLALPPSMRPLNKPPPPPAELLVRVQFVMVSVLRLAMAPPSNPPVLPEKVQLLTSALPQLLIPPPCSAPVLPENVL